MKFLNKAEKMEWLKETSKRIFELENDRMQAVMDGDFEKAFSLLKGKKFAEKLFREVSFTLRKRK